MSSLKTFFGFSYKTKWMCLEALVLSAHYRYLVLKKPFVKYADSIGVQGYESSETENKDLIILEIRKAVEAVCKRTPWESKCLVRALTAKKMLNRRGYFCTLYMGVAMDTAGVMVAHAWLRCGNVYVTGGNGGKRYTVTAIFGDKC